MPRWSQCLDHICATVKSSYAWPDQFHCVTMLKRAMKLVSSPDKLASLLDGLDSEAVSSLVREGLPGDNSTLLHRAAQMNCESTIRLLITRYQSPVDPRTTDYKTPLHEAANHGHTASCKALIELGGSVDAHKANNWTPLMYAAQGGHLSTVKLLLAVGANLHERNKDGATPLYLACRNDNPDMVELLLNAGSDISTLTHTNSTPVHCAARENQVRVAKVLLEHGADANAVDKIGFTVWHQAAQDGSVDMIRMFLAMGLAPPKGGLAAKSVFLCAVCEGRVEVALLLLDELCWDVEDSDEKGSAMYWASARGHLDMMRELHARGARVDAGPGCRGPLHLAAGWGRTQIVRQLIDWGADAGLLDSEGKTAAMIAANRGHTEVCKLLPS